jgi:hypothetical protein
MWRNKIDQEEKRKMLDLGRNHERKKPNLKKHRKDTELQDEDEESSKHE